MSILWTLRKHIDAVQQREEDAQRRVAREVPHTIRVDGVGPRHDDPAVEAAARPYRCRVCGTVATTQHYCPECLADTMEPLPDDDG